MIVVLYSEVWSDRLVARDYLVGRFGMTPVECERAIKNLAKMEREDLTNYVVWDCLTEIDVETFEYAGGHSIYISRRDVDPKIAGKFHFTIENDDDVRWVRRQLLDAIIAFTEKTGKASRALRRGIEHAFNE
jgi:hypothetical protein